jgi:cytochrome c peroxidase
MKSTRFSKWLLLLGLVFQFKSLAAADAPAATQQSRPAVIALGQRLFNDPRLSANGQIACASCHQPDKQFSDGLPLALGIHGRKGTRNTPSLLDVGEQRTLFWDGRRESLEAQALDPLLNPAEHGLADEAALLRLLRTDPGYVDAFKTAFATPAEHAMQQPEAALVSTSNLALALAAFQRSLVSGPTAFDRFRSGDVTALEPAARRGWLLFSTTAQCIRCHSAEGARPLFTDHGFHSLAVGLHRIERKLPDLTQKLVKLHQDGRAFDREVLSDADLAELGRFAVTLNPPDIAKFKTPGLRNVALTAPYMHDGSVASLEEAVDLELYHRGAQNGLPLILTLQERADLVAFLRALNSSPTPPICGGKAVSSCGIVPRGVSF